MTASQPPQHTSAPDPAVTTAGPPPVPTDRSFKQTERPHPLTPFVRGWLIFVAIAIGWGREIVTSASEDQFDAGGLSWILPILGIVVVLAAITGFVAWYFTRFVIDDEELRIETGCDLQEIDENPVRAAPVRRHHPTTCRTNVRPC